MTVWISRRHFRVGAWAPLLVGTCPLLCFAKLLIKLREYYGQDYWAQPNVKQIYDSYNSLLNVDSHWGFIFAAGITVIILYSSMIKTPRNGVLGGERNEATSVPIEERTLALMLLWLPVIAVTVTKVSHGGLTGATCYQLSLVAL